MEDREIVTMYEARDENAILETKIKYGQHLLNLGFNILKNRADAEECENDTYLRVWNRIPPTKPLNFFAWLMKIGRNICFRRLETKKREKRTAVIVELSDELAECFADPDTVEAQIERGLPIALIERYLDGQTREKQFLFTRRYFYGDSYADLARYSGKREGTVRTLLCRMRQEIRELLEEEGVGP